MGKPLRTGAFPDRDAVGVSVRFLTENCVPIIGHASGNIANRFTLVQDDREDLSWLHGLELQLSLDEVVRADDPAQIQLCVCLGRGGDGLALTSGVHLSTGPLCCPCYQVERLLTSSWGRDRCWSEEEVVGKTGKGGRDT